MKRCNTAPEEAPDAEDVTRPLRLTALGQDMDGRDFIVSVPSLGASQVAPLKLRAAAQGTDKRAWHKQWLSSTSNEAFIVPIMYGALKLRHPFIKFVSDSVGDLLLAEYTSRLRANASARGFTIESMHFTDEEGLWPTDDTINDFLDVTNHEPGFHDVRDRRSDVCQALLAAANCIRDGLCKVYSVENRRAGPIHVKDPDSSIEGCGHKLPPEQAKLVDRWLHMSVGLGGKVDRDRVMAWDPTFPVCLDEFSKLKDKGWLMGAVLSHGLRHLNVQHDLLLSQKATSPHVELTDKGVDGLLSVFCLPTTFHSALCGKGRGPVRLRYDEATGWAHVWGLRLDVKKRDLLLIPVNVNNYHWYLVVLDTRRKVLHVYNSLIACGHAENSSELRLIIEWFCMFSATGSAHEWSIIFHPFAPQQINSYDCGVFTYNFARCIAAGVAFDFSQIDCEPLRRRHAYEMLRHGGKAM